VGFFFSSCLLGARARTFASKNKKKPQTTDINSFPDDSGSKLRTKEQQRLSSK